MSTASSFFLAVFHFFALVWATIHPEVNPNQHNVGFQQIAHAVRVEYRQNKAERHLLSASTHAIDTGYWHTSGNLIVDERSQPVKVQGINWYGFDTVRKVPGGLALQDYRAILDSIHRSGFNAVRIP